MPERSGKEVQPPAPRAPHATAQGAAHATAQDVGTLGISALRSLVHAAGLRTDDCIEITDLRERAREALALPNPEDAAPGPSALPSARGSGSTDQPPMAAQPPPLPPQQQQPPPPPAAQKPPPAAQKPPAVRKRVTIHESSDDSDDDLVLTRRPQS